MPSLTHAVTETLTGNTNTTELIELDTLYMGKCWGIQMHAVPISEFLTVLPKSADNLATSFIDESMLHCIEFGSCERSFPTIEQKVHFHYTLSI